MTTATLPPETASRLVSDLDEAAYHADPYSVSASGLKLLLKAPALFRWQQDNPAEPRDHFDVGTACHTRILGTGSPAVPIDCDAKRGKAWTDPADAARAEGKTPLLRKEFDAVERMADAVLADPTARRLLTGGESEVSAYWRDPEWDVTRRARFDHLTQAPAGHIIADLKTTASAEPGRLPKVIVDYGYDLSAAHYIDVARGCGLDVAAYSLIFVDKTPPHCVVVAELDDDFLDRGRRLCATALERYRDCLAADSWPGYVMPGEFLTLTPPAWALREDA